MTASSPRRAVRGAFRRVARFGPILSVDTPRQEIVLTFDDGPDPIETPRVLRALAGEGATATFFVLSSRVRLFPDVLHQVIDAGHEIALHGPDHRPYTDFSPGQLADRSSRAREELERLTGREVRWVRPPYGRLSFGGWRALRQAGLDAVLWGPSLRDSREASDAERLHHALEGARAGSIVLAHDAFADHRDGVDDGSAPVLDRAALVSAVVEGYRARGLRTVALGEAATEASLRRSPVFVRSRATSA